MKCSATSSMLLTALAGEVAAAANIHGRSLYGESSSNHTCQLSMFVIYSIQVLCYNVLIKSL